MSEIKWKFQFRSDQCDFIVDAMNYIIARADERLDGSKYQPFEKFAAHTTKKLAEEIRNEIASVIG